MIKPFCNFRLFIANRYPHLRQPRRALTGASYTTIEKHLTMFRYLFSTAVAILMFFTVTRAQYPILQKSPSPSTFTEQPRTSDIFTLGLDIGPTTPGKGYLSLAILIPFRSPDAQNYIDQLNANGVSFNNSLIPSLERS